MFAGYEPATDLVKGLAECDAQGYVVTDRNQKTTCEGLYAAGDVCIKSLRQVVTAVGDGALAATELERYAAALQKKTGLYPVQPMSKEIPAVTENNQKTDGLFTSDMLSQLESVFQKMTSPLKLKLYLDDTPLSVELKGYMEELCALTDKLSLEMSGEEMEDSPCAVSYTHLPVRICPISSGHRSRMGSMILRSSVPRVFPNNTKRPSPLLARIRFGMVAAISK